MVSLQKNEIPTDLDLDVAHYINSGMNRLGDRARALRQAEPLQDQLIGSLEQFSTWRLSKLARFLRSGRKFDEVATMAERADWYMEGAKIDLHTGLPTKIAFAENMESAIERIRRNVVDGCLLLQFDLNSFKTINDKYGSGAGDRAIQIFSQALKNVTRDHTDMIASRKQAGGDEFYLLAERSYNEQLSPDEIKERIVARVFERVHFLMSREDFEWVVKDDSGNDALNKPGIYAYAAVGSVSLDRARVGDTDSKLSTEDIFKELESSFNQDKVRLKARRG